MISLYLLLIGLALLAMARQRRIDQRRQDDRRIVLLRLYRACNYRRAA